MTFKTIVLALIVFLIVRAVRKAMRAQAGELPGAAASRASIPPKRAAPKPDPAPPKPTPGSPHDVLGVPPGASPEVIRAAYQKLAKEYHPDRVAGLAPELQALAHERMVAINRAHDALTKG